MSDFVFHYHNCTNIYLFPIFLEDAPFSEEKNKVVNFKLSEPEIVPVNNFDSFFLFLDLFH